jgi:Aspartyl/Asparaginyl beta-hydroxylase
MQPLPHPSPGLSPSPYLLLPFSFDVGQLQEALAAVEATRPWVSHFNTLAYEASYGANWSCIALRSVGGVPDQIIPIDGAAYEDTAALLASPYLQQVIKRFECEKTSVRLMALEPGGVIKPHRDAGTSLDDGVTRLHIPIQTTPEVLFCIDGQAVHFTAGHTWYLNASCLHGVVNASALPRVHLMIDCVTNPWLQAVFEAAGGVLRPPAPYGDPIINDDNVLAVIAALRAGGHGAGTRLADRLELTHAGRHHA